MNSTLKLFIIAFFCSTSLTIALSETSSHTITAETWEVVWMFLSVLFFLLGGFLRNLFGSPDYEKLARLDEEEKEQRKQKRLQKLGKGRAQCKVKGSSTIYDGRTVYKPKVSKNARKRESEEHLWEDDELSEAEGGESSAISDEEDGEE